jgi:hypothetical protein
MTTAATRELRKLGFDGETALADIGFEAQERIKAELKLLDSITMQLYFASGTHDQRRSDFGSEPPSLAKKRTFLIETDSIVNDLARVGLPHAAHNLLGMFECLADADPTGVFLKMGELVRASARYGYQYEGLAAELVVKIVERYLADFRTHLRESAECRKVLIDVLDIFVRAGWPKATLLAYRLNDIYR